MASEIEIINVALLALGVDPIINPDQIGTNARTLQSFYPIERDAVLRAHPWNCALYRTTLAVETATPAFGYAYQYTLPADPYALRVYSLEDASIEYRVEGRKVLTDEGAPLYALLIVRPSDPSEFDPLLADAIGMRLAWRAAYRITQNRALVNDCLDQYQAILREARSIDAQEGTPETISSDELLIARY